MTLGRSYFSIHVLPGNLGNAEQRSATVDKRHGDSTWLDWRRLKGTTNRAKVGGGGGKGREVEVVARGRGGEWGMLERVGDGRRVSVGIVGEVARMRGGKKGGGECERNVDSGGVKC